MTLSSSSAITAIFDSYNEPIVCIAGLGRTAGIVERLARCPTLTLDAMGCVTSFAVGVAIGLQKSARVVAIDTDGSLMLEVGALAAVSAAKRLIAAMDIYVIDNGLYESGGGGPSRHFSLVWENLFAAFGLDHQVINDQAQLEQRLQARSGALTCTVLQVVNKEEPGSPSSPYDGREKVTRFSQLTSELTGSDRWPRASKL